jgi:peptidoglycan/xylan/chitin deacetylase (PgdA/CDA1 family)
MITILTFVTICMAVCLYFGVPWIYGRRATILLTRKTKKHNVLVLTFDDGPGTRLTAPILHILEQHNAKATFFVLGRQVLGRGQIVREIVERGHQIGSHGYDHLNHWKVSPIRAIKDIRRGWQAIDDVLGIKRGIYPFRPPFGKLNLLSLLYLLLLRVPIFYWTRDLGDTWQFDAWFLDKSKNKTAPQSPITPVDTTGDVILAHDFDRCDMSVDPFILRSVESTLALAENNRLRVLTASELLKAD